MIDTETSDFETWAEVFDSHGVHLDRALWTQYIGRGSHIFDIYDHLETLVGRSLDRDAIRAERSARHMELVEANPVLPGVLDLLGEAVEQGVPVGVASSSTRRWVVGHLERVGILDSFDSVLCRDDVSATKPDPELYTRSAEALGGRPGPHSGHRGLPQRHRGGQGRQPLLRRGSQPHDPRPAHRRSRRAGRDSRLDQPGVPANLVVGLRLEHRAVGPCSVAMTLSACSGPMQ